MSQTGGRLTRRVLLLRAIVIGITGPGALLGACQVPTSPVRPADARSADLKTAEPKPAQTAAPTAKPSGGTPTAGTPSALAGTLVSTLPGPPKPGGSLVWAAEADPTFLDPHLAANAVGIKAWGDLIYQSLVMFDENMKLVPCLAEAWLNTSPTTWTFKLRQGVRFHDGSEFEAADVKFWYDWLKTPRTGASPVGDWFGQIVQVEPKGRYEVEFTLGQPYAPFLVSFAALRGSAMAPRGWLQQAGADPKRSAVGSGPFKLAEYVPGSHLRYVKHPDYWERGLPYLDEVVLTFEPDEEKRVAALRAGQVTYASIGADAARRLKSVGSLTVLSSPGPIQHVTRLNTARPPLDDIRVRQAIALAVDRSAVLTKVLGGEGKLTGPIPTGLGEWAMAPESLPYRQDLAAAKRLLADADHDDDDLELTIKTDSRPIPLGIATLLADQLRAAGMTVTVQQLDASALADAIAAKSYDLLTASNPSAPDPDAYLSRYASQAGVAGAPSANPNGLTGLDAARYDEIVGQARGILDPGQRKALYDEATGILLREAPAIWWCTENTIEALHASVKGYAQSYTGRRLGLKKTSLDR